MAENRPQSKRFLKSLNFSQENFNKAKLANKTITNKPHFISSAKTRDKEEKVLFGNTIDSRSEIKSYFQETSKKRNYTNLMQVIKTDILNIDDYIKQNSNFLMMFQDILPNNDNNNNVNKDGAFRSTSQNPYDFSHQKSDNNKKMININSISNHINSIANKTFRLTSYNNNNNNYNSYLGNSASNRAKIILRNLIDEVKSENVIVKEQIEEIVKVSESIDSILEKYECNSKESKDDLILRLYLENALNELFFRKLKEAFLVEELKYYGTLDELVDKSSLINTLSRFNAVSSFFNRFNILFSGNIQKDSKKNSNKDIINIKNNINQNNISNINTITRKRISNKESSSSITKVLVVSTNNIHNSDKKTKNDSNRCSKCKIKLSDKGLSTVSTVNNYNNNFNNNNNIWVNNFQINQNLKIKEEDNEYYETSSYTTKKLFEELEHQDFNNVDNFFQNNKRLCDYILNLNTITQLLEFNSKELLNNNNNNNNILIENEELLNMSKIIPDESKKKFNNVFLRTDTLNTNELNNEFFNMNNNNNNIYVKTTNLSVLEIKTLDHLKEIFLTSILKIFDLLLLIKNEDINNLINAISVIEGSDKIKKNKDSLSLRNLTNNSNYLEVFFKQYENIKKDIDQLLVLFKAKNTESLSKAKIIEQQKKEIAALKKEKELRLSSTEETKFLNIHYKEVIEALNDLTKFKNDDKRNLEKRIEELTINNELLKEKIEIIEKEKEFDYNNISSVNDNQNCSIKAQYKKNLNCNNDYESLLKDQFEAMKSSFMEKIEEKDWILKNQRLSYKEKLLIIQEDNDRLKLVQKLYLKQSIKYNDIINKLNDLNLSKLLE